MKTHAIIFTLGLLLGLFFSFMYRTLVINFPQPVVSEKSVLELKKEVANTEVTYAKSIDSLTTNNAALNDELIRTKVSLQTIKAANVQLTTKATFLIRKSKEDKKDILTSTVCDSLVTNVEHLIVSHSEKDSLYEAVTGNLSAQIANKDSTIILKDEQYLSLKFTFDKSLSNQQLLVDENKLLSKQVRKQKAKGKFLSAALMLITGTAIHQFISR